MFVLHDCMILLLYVGGARIFPYEFLKSITDNFDASHMVGKGGHGKVYEAVINETHVALKVLSSVSLLYKSCFFV